jgi:hypothetical protein
MSAGHLVIIQQLQQQNLINLSINLNDHCGPRPISKLNIFMGTIPFHELFYFNFRQVKYVTRT